MEGYIIREGNRPWWQRLIAALLYTVTFVLLLLFFTNFQFTLDTKMLKGSFGLLEISIFTFFNALAFSVVRDFVFDIENRRFKILYCVGPIELGSWRKLPEIEYVSVFKQLLADGNYVYETNLWYQGNRHMEIYENLDKAMAFEMGREIAKILNVSLLDATVPNNYVWVDVDFQK